MLRAHAVLASHPWSARVWITRTAVGPHRSAFLNVLLELLNETGRRILGQLEERGHAHMAEHVRQHLDETFAGHNGFAFGLDLILEGLASRR